MRSTTLTREPCIAASAETVRNLTQALLGACRQVEAGRVGPVHHVDVVVAGKSDQKSGELRVRRQGIEKLCPFRRTAGIGQISRDQDRVERLLRVDLVQSRQGLPEPLVASRAGPSALDPEAVPLAHGVDVGQMRYAPGPAALRPRIKGTQIARLGHGRVGYAPDERRPAEIARDNHDGVRQRDRDEQVRRREIREVADPARGRPSERDEPQCEPR